MNRPAQSGGLQAHLAARRIGREWFSREVAQDLTHLVTEATRESLGVFLAPDDSEGD